LVVSSVISADFFHYSSIQKPLMTTHY
jgi:hypothetical protein